MEIALLAVLCAIGTILFSPGCTGVQKMLSTPEGRYEALLMTYNDTLKGVNILIDAGEITAEEAPGVIVAIKSAKRAIDILHGKVLAGVDSELAEKAARAALSKLKGAAE